MTVGKERRQCWRGNGHGPEGEYCYQHSKIIESIALGDGRWALNSTKAR